MELSASELWSRILDAARSGLPEQSFRTWLATTVPVALSEEELLVEVPNEFHLEWVEDKYGALLTELAHGAVGRPLQIAFRCGPQRHASAVPHVEVSASVPPAPDVPSGSRRPGLNERYTFDRFVVGTNNQLAAAASQAVADKPARMYNPLFLYGGVGLGKTHLMHAIGNRILEQDASRRVAYVTSEQFMNELVTAIRVGQTPEFRQRYRQMDLLLVDDVHFLKGKEGTQEEFFHTFNALHEARKQIILTSDRPPAELPGLEDRLVSRFTWGLVADLKPPDFETRVAILRKKAADDSLTLDEEVIDFIARSCTSSVRELEGAVIKLLAYSSLTNQEITVALAGVALQGVLRPGIPEAGEDAVTPEAIREAVARRWSVRPEALSSKRRTKDLTVPRQVAMYLIKELLDIPLVQIGELFGGRDHSTVIHSIRKVEEGLAGEDDYRKRVEQLRIELVRRL